MTDDLAGFVLACIADDEEVALRESTWATGAPLTAADWDYVAGDADSTLVAIYSPMRVLAECAAKRALIAAVQGDPFDALGAESAYELLVLKHLAAPFADRPGFREEWRR